MATASQVSQLKRGRDEYWNGGLPLPDTKQMNSGVTGARDSDLMALLDQIDNLCANDSYPEGTDASNELEICEIGMNGVIKSLEDEFGLMSQTENKMSTNEKGGADWLGPFKQGTFTEGGSNFQETSARDIADWTYYNDVGTELSYFGEDIFADDLGFIIDDSIYGDSTSNITYSDTVHGYAETTEDFYGFLWEDDIWQLNEHPVMLNDFESSQQQEVRLVVSEPEFPDVWNDIRAVQCLNDDEKGL